MMTAAGRRAMKRLENRITVLEAERARHITAYTSTLHTIVQQETALRDALDALQEAAAAIAAVLPHV